jgi:hypothetical protein
LSVEPAEVPVKVSVPGLDNAEGVTEAQSLFTGGGGGAPQVTVVVIQVEFVVQLKRLISTRTVPVNADVHVTVDCTPQPSSS